MRARAALVLFGGLGLACAGESLTTGLEEPIRVEGAQFHEGPLPGLPPLSAAELSAGAQPEPPFPTPPEVAGRILNPLEVGFVVAGRASTDTHAIGFQLEGLGSGYWLIPVGAPDPINSGELTWRVLIDLGANVPAGLSNLRVAAIDGAGSSGTQRALELCVRAPSADNLNACDPTIAPPASVLSLSWDGPADLDLSVLAADGTSVDRHTPRPTSGGVRGAQLERDANRSCVAHGMPRENVLWQDPPEPGVYAVYVNLNDACGERSVGFELTAHVREPLETDGEFTQVESFETSGVLSALQANGGTDRGLRIGEVEF